MYKTQAKSVIFLREFMPGIETAPVERQVILCVPFTNLSVVMQTIKGTRVALGSQNIHWETQGAFTGEIAAPMLQELGVTYAIVGHSERRLYFGETDETVNKRALAAQRRGITPIICVGESKEQHEAGETESHVISQLKQALIGLDPENLVIAYEPIWAIGTGATCDAIEANRIIGLIRSHLIHPDVPIQYGGSVKPKNIDEIMSQPEIDGVLVGGASLEPIDFARIVNYKQL